MNVQTSIQNSGQSDRSDHISRPQTQEEADDSHPSTERPKPRRLNPPPRMRTNAPAPQTAARENVT